MYRFKSGRRLLVLFMRSLFVPVFHSGGQRCLVSGPHGKSTPFHSDGEDTGGLSSVLGAFRCVPRSSAKLWREGMVEGVLIIL